MYPASLCLFLLFVLHSVITEALRTLLSHQSARRYDGDVAFLLAFPVLTSHLKVLQNNVFGHLLTHRCSPCCPSWHSWILLSTIDLIWSLYAALRATQKTLWSLICDARVSRLSASLQLWSGLQFKACAKMVWKGFHMFLKCRGKDGRVKVLR